MAAEPIHVEAEDEVPAIIERIRRTAGDEVRLVLPPMARFGRSRFNFQLLKQYSTRLGKRVAIWSPDPAVQRLAEESGFGAFRPPQPAGQLPNGAPGHARAPGPPRAGTQPPRGVQRPAFAAAGGPAPPGVQPRPAGPPAPQPPWPGQAPPVPRTAPAPGGVPAGAPVRPEGSGQAGSGRIARQPQPVPPRIRIGAPRRMPDRLARQVEPMRYLLYAGAVLVLLAGIVAVLFYVPSARVTLVAQAQPFSTQVDLASEPGGKSPVRVRAVSVTKQGNFSMQSTGVKMVGGQLASGQFTYVNNCAVPLQILNGQRLRSVTGVVFAQLGDTVVQHNSTATVSIRATQAGQAGNVGAGQITGIELNTLDCLTGTNQAPATGGSDDQKQTVIQGSDIQSAKAQLEQQLRQQVLDELGKGVQKGEKLVNQANFGAEEFSTTHNVDENYPSFTATLKLTAEGDYYMSEDVDKAFSDRLAGKVPKNQQLTTNKIAATYTVTPSPGGHLSFNGTANGYIAPRIDTDRVRSQLAGKPAAQAHDVLTTLPIRRSEIRQSPPLPMMPLSSARIYIDYGVDAAPGPKTG